MAEQNLLSRFSSAMKAFRVSFSNANQAGGWQGGNSVIPIDDQFTFARAIQSFRNTQIDYAKEIGDVSKSSLVMAAVNWVGRTLHEAPMRVVEDDQAGSVEPVADHPAAKLLARPNPDYSGATLLNATALSWILSGNAYWLKQRGIRNQPVRLYWWPHWLIRPIRAAKKDYISYYEYAVDGVWQRIEREDVIHFRDGIDPVNDMLGLSPLASLIREIFTDGEVTNYQATITKNGAVIPFAVAPKGTDAEFDPKATKDELMRRISGDERGKPPVFSSGIEILRLSVTPAEMAIDSIRHVPEERLAGVIGIPGMVLGFGSALQRSTFSNYQQAREAAYESYLVPLWRYLDDELTQQFLKPDYEGADSSARIEHDLSGVRALQEDEDAKHRRIGMDYQQGIITRAEARGALGYEVEDKLDDVFLARSGTATVPRDAKPPEITPPEQPALPESPSPNQETATPQDSPEEPEPITED